MKPAMNFLLTLALGGLVLGLVVLYRTDVVRFWILTAVLITFAVLAIVYVAVTSVYVIGPNDMIASYFQGSWSITYVNRKYGQKLRADLAAAWRYGHLRDLVFLLWFAPLLWQGLRFPTTAIKLPVRAGRVLTARGCGLDENLSPRVRLRLDTTMILRLSPNVAAVVETFEILHGDVGWDLTRKEPMEDKTGRTILAPCIAKTLLETAQETILEAVRVASARYTWGGKLDIVSKKTELEKDVLRILSEEESLFVQAGILQKIDKGWENPPEGQPCPEPKEGSAAISVDFNIEEIAPDPIPEGASELEKAIDQPLIAVLKAEATRRQAEADAYKEEHVGEGRGKGRGKGLREVAANLGLDARDKEAMMELYRGEVVREATPNTTFIAMPKEEGTGSLAALMAAFFGGARPPRGGTPPSASPTGGTPPGP